MLLALLVSFWLLCLLGTHLALRVININIVVIFVVVVGGGILSGVAVAVAVAFLVLLPFEARVRAAETI